MDVSILPAHHVFAELCLSLHGLVMADDKQGKGHL